MQATPAVDAPMYLAAIVDATDDAIVGTTVDGVMEPRGRAALRNTAAETVGKAVAKPVAPAELVMAVANAVGRTG